MPKSATDVMQEIVVAAVLDAVVALKDASRGVPNALLRDLNAVHRNTTLGDLPKEAQAAIAASVRDAFARLRKEGYTVAGQGAAPSSAPATSPRAPSPRSRPPAGPPLVETRKRPPVRPGKGPPPKSR